MAYIGRSPVIGSFKKIDDLTSQFNGSQTVFTLTSGGAAVDPGTSQNLLVSLGGVVQEPVTAYTVSGTTITFTGAPANTQAFFAVQLGDALDVGYLTQGVSIEVTNINAAGTLKVTSNATLSNTLSVTGAVNALSTLGVTGIFTALANSTLTGAVTMSNTVSITGAANALSALGVGGTLSALGQLSVTGNATFDTSTLFVDATNDRVGVGTTTPVAKLHIGGTTVNAIQAIFTTGAGDGNFRFRIKNGVTGVDNAAQAKLSLDYADTNFDIASMQFLRSGSAGGKIAFFTGEDANGTERMRITQTGLIGIGNTAPGYTLDVHGVIRTSTGQLYSDHSSAQVTVAATNTWYDLVTGLPHGVFIFRDISNGGSAVIYGDTSFGYTALGRNGNLAGLEVRNTTTPNRLQVRLTSGTVSTNIRFMIVAAALG